VHDAGFVTAEAVTDVADDGVEAGAPVTGGPGQSFARLERDRAVRGQRVFGVHGQKNVLAQEGAAGDVAVPGDGDRVVFDADDEIDQPGVQLVQGWGSLPLVDLDLQVGCGGGEPVECGGQQRQCGGLHDRHAEPSGQCVSDGGQFGANRLVGGEGIGRVGGQAATGGGEFDVAARPSEQFDARFAFELRELHRDAGGAVGQRVSDRGHGTEVGQVIEKA
jgi:hypothetical protein